MGIDEDTHLSRLSPAAGFIGIGVKAGIPSCRLPACGGQAISIYQLYRPRGKHPVCTRHILSELLPARTAGVYIFKWQFVKKN
jgi:hypothetical protein